MENGGLCVILDLIAMQLLLCADNSDIVLVLPPLGPPGEYSITFIGLSEITKYMYEPLVFSLFIQLRQSFWSCVGDISIMWWF